MTNAELERYRKYRAVANKTIEKVVLKLLELGKWTSRYEHFGAIHAKDWIIDETCVYCKYVKFYDLNEAEEFFLSFPIEFLDDKYFDKWYKNEVERYESEAKEKARIKAADKAEYELLFKKYKDNPEIMRLLNLKGSERFW